MHYGFEITPDNMPLVTFLNDGVAPQLKSDPTFLICEINGPCEITTKVVTRAELTANPIKDLLHKM